MGCQSSPSFQTGLLQQREQEWSSLAMWPMNRLQVPHLHRSAPPLFIWEEITQDDLDTLAVWVHPGLIPHLEVGFDAERILGSEDDGGL